MSLFDYLCLLALVYASVLAWYYRHDASKAKKRAAEGEGRFLQLFEEVPLACQEIDMDGIVRRVNHKLCDLRGLRPSSILGKHCADLAAEGDAERVREETTLKLSGEAPLVPQKHTYVRRDGGTVTASVAPQDLEGDDLLAGVDGQQNALILRTDVLDEIVIVQRGGGLTQTAYALLSDLVAIARDLTGASATRRSPSRARRHRTP